MRLAFVLLATGLTALLLTACGGPSSSSDDAVETVALDTPAGTEAYTPTLDGPLRVLSTAPAGEQTSMRPRQPISVTFSRSMVPVGDAAPPPPEALTITPAVPGSLRWDGTQTLVYHPSEDLPPATAFTVTLDTSVTDPDGTALAEPYTWTFQTPRLQLVSSSPADDAQFAAPDSSIRLSFSLPVDAQSATPYVHPDFPVASITNDGDSTLIVTPRTALAPDIPHTVTLKEGLPPRTQDLGLGEERTVRFRVRPDPALKRLDQPGHFGDDDRISPDRGVRLEFSTPVRFGDLRNALSFTPSVDLLPGVEARDSNVGTTHTLPATFEPDTRYTLTIDSLRDQFGRTLTDATASFRTRAFEPHFDMGEGMMVIEATQQPALPVQATNVDSIQLGLESLSADDVIPALPAYDEATQYDRRADSTRPPVEATRTVDLPIERNTLATVPLRLDSMLTDSTGLVGVRVIHPDLGNAHGPDPDRRALAQVTRLGVTGKFSPHQNLVVVTTLDTGTPVEGATVTIRDAQNTVHWQGQTDADGRVQTPGWNTLGIEKTDKHSRPTQYAIVEHEGDVAFTSTRHDDGIEPYRLGVNYDWNPDSTTHTGSVFSDRGLYKTGETVHLKGILRAKTDADWAARTDSVRVRVEDPHNETVLDRVLQPSALGSFALDWAVPGEAAQGYYEVQVFPAEYTRESSAYHWDDVIASGTFQVRSFRRASFSVTAHTSRDHYVAGDLFEGRVSARYLFGAGMAGRPTTMSLYRRSTSYTPPGYDGFQFGPTDPDYFDTGALLETETTLDSTSTAAAERVRLPGNEQGAPATLSWGGTVTAPSRQTRSTQTTATLHPGRYYIGLKPSTSFLDLSQDSTLSVDVITVDPNGASVGEKEVTVELIRRQWNSVREVGADGRLRWRSDPTETVVQTREVTTTAGQRMRLSMTVPAGGQYRLRATGQDLRGNTIRSDTYLHASGSGYTAWERDDDDRIEVVPENTDYAPGETARLMVKSPYEEATALITVEREGILQSRVTTLTGSTPMIELPITEEYLPNVFVGVILLKGRTAPPRVGSDPGAPSFKIGYASLSVDPDQKRLQVDLSPDQEQYRPGETATVDLQLTDAAGRGVPGEIAFSAADAGVLDLIDYRLPDPFDTFYGARRLGVSTSELRAEIVEQRSYGQKAEDAGGGGGAAEADGLSSPRTDFRPSAHWASSIQTDDDGEATVSFKLPESLTTFRLMATAHTADHQFGAATEDIVVTKPLVLKDALPRFARIDDTFEAGVLVTNRSDEAGTATVTASAPSSAGLTIDGDSTRTVELDAGATREVRFDWTASAAGDAALTFRARLNGETDAMTTSLPVQRPTTKTTSATFASTADTAREALRTPGDRVPGLGQFDVTLASTALVGLDGAVEHLFEYPYGCLEQATSRVRPLLTGGALLDAFDLQAFADRSRDEAVRSWMRSLSKYQVRRGFSLWEGSTRVNPYVTGYVLLTLAEAQDAGYDLPQPLTDNAIDAGADLVRNRSDKPAYYGDDVWRDTRAFLLYALARHGRVLESELTWLADHPPTSVEGQSHLLRTLLIADLPALDDTKQRLVTQLKQRVRVEAGTAFLAAPNEENYGWIFSSDVRTTAFGLTALLKATPSDEFQPLAQRMIRFLMDRRQQGHWPSTQDNAAVLTAFQHYVDTYEDTTPDFSASVELAGRSILDAAFQGRSLTTSTTTLSADALPDNRDLPLQATKTGPGTLYYSMRLTTYASPPQDALDQGLRVERTVQRLNDRGEPKGTPLRTGNNDLTLASGALVKVTLRLSSPTDRPYVVVDDALPAGLEPVNEAFATTDQEVLDEAGTGSDRWWGSFNHTEMKDDRVLLFADRLASGEHTYSYVARATTPGTFTHPPAEAELMYRPETRGHTATGTLVVTPPAEPTADR